MVAQAPFFYGRGGEEGGKRFKEPGFRNVEPGFLFYGEEKSFQWFKKSFYWVSLRSERRIPCFPHLRRPAFIILYGS